MLLRPRARSRATRRVSYGRLLLVLALAVPSTQCINGSPEGPAPTSPTPPARTLSSITVTGLSGAANPGATAQLTANATYSDGASETVTQQAAWETGNAAVATVSAGLVTFVALGEADVRATFRSVTGVARIAVTAAPVRRFTLTGLLTDADNRRGINGVRVEIADGADAGRSTTSASDGTFTLADLAEGTFSVRLTHRDFEAAVRAVTLTAAARLDVALRPLVDAAPFYGTFNVGLRVTQQTCETPITPAASGQLSLSGNADGSSFIAVLVERGTTRVYGGNMRADGSFNGGGGGVIAGARPGDINRHDYTGNIQGRVTGNSVTGVEFVTYGIPCPGKIIDIAFSGSR